MGFTDFWVVEFVGNTFLSSPDLLLACTARLHELSAQPVEIYFCGFKVAERAASVADLSFCRTISGLTKKF